jgi:hypothetical protein
MRQERSVRNFADSVTPLAHDVRRLWHDSYLWRSIACLAVLFFTYFYVASDFPANVYLVRTQVICFVVAGLLILVVNTEGFSRPVTKRILKDGSTYTFATIVVLAVGLRHIALDIFPSDQQTGFEEIQAGEDGRELLLTSDLPLEFRFTKILSALGLHFGGESLHSLRQPFHITAYLGLVLVGLSLRRLSVSWGAVVFALLTMATLRWLVIAAGTADELFAGLFVAIVVIYGIIASETSATHTFLWTGVAGIGSGMLAYEYTSYRALPFVLGMWLLWRAIRATGEARGRHALAFLLFVSTLAIIAAPTFVQTIRSPDDSMFLEGFRRQGHERPALAEYVTKSRINIREYSSTLIGFRSDASYFYTRPREPVVPLPIGLLFAASLMIELLKPSRSVSRLLAASVIFTVFGAAVSANNLNVGRMTPCLPPLIILTALTVHRIGMWTVRRLGTSEIGAAGLALAAVAVAINLSSIQGTAHDQSVLNEFSNDAYATCHHIGKVATAGQTVYFYSVDHRGICDPRSYNWLYDNSIAFRPVNQLPTASKLERNDIVIVGKSGGMNPSEMNGFLRLASSTNSARSVRLSKNVAGRTAAASFCFECTR